MYSDIGTILWAYDDSSEKYKYLVPIRTAPATGGMPNKIDVTELDSEIEQAIFGREPIPDYTFEYNHSAANYAAVKALASKIVSKKFLVTYADKSGLKFEGMLATWRNEVGKDSGLVDNLSIAVQTKEDVVDCTSIVDATTIPTGKKDVFTTTTFTVTFDLNTGAGTTVTALTCASGGYVTLPDSDAVLESDDFNCWNTLANGSGTNLAVGSKYYATANVTLYAKY